MSPASASRFFTTNAPWEASGASQDQLIFGESTSKSKCLTSPADARSINGILEADGVEKET